MIKILYLAVGSMTGGFARYYMAGAVQKGFGSAFPYGTLAVNLTGCFLIGLFGSIAHERSFLGPEGRLLLMTGFCGAFTTFSALMFETHDLMKSGEFFRATLNVVLSFAAGLIFYRLGVLLGEYL